MKRAAFVLMIALAMPVFAQQVQPEPTVNELKAQVAQLKMQILQLQSSLLQCQAPQVQLEIQAAQAAVKADKEKAVKPEKVQPALNKK